MIVAYCCLPYRGETKEDIAANIQRAQSMAAAINLIPGWRALVPHNFSIGHELSLTEPEWLDFDIEVMNRAADVLVYDKALSVSSGCLRERAEFRGLIAEVSNLSLIDESLTNGWQVG